MITCELNGRLGNQMFQIAATIGTAVKHGVPYSIPKATLNNWFPVYFNHLPEHHLGITRKIKTYIEPESRYREISYSSGTLRLNGYFQSYKYFEHCLPEVRQAFNLPQFLAQDFVSVHIRRGDYLTNPDFAVLGMEYYSNAITYFAEKGHRQFIVFSDDITWCKRNITEAIYPGCRILYSEQYTEVQDMGRMACCGHHIVANSSFSVMAAILSLNVNKIVVCPSLWFKGRNQDMLPPEWLIFKNE